MCNKGATPRLLQGRKATPVTALKKPARKSRTRTRKPKFLSLLRLDSSPVNTQQQSAGEMTEAAAAAQLDLFPLHPENQVEDNVSYFFDAADGGATTLTTLLGARSSSSWEDEDALSPSTLTSYAYGGHDSEEGDHDLVRTALRNKERDASEEEKWVCYSEVVLEERKDEEVTSCAGAGDDLLCRYKIRTQQRGRRLSLKLDYEEIMSAWSDKGPLYIQLESPQTVPDLEDDFWAAHDYSSNGMWRVPEMSSSGGMKVNNSCSSTGKLGNLVKVKEEVIYQHSNGSGVGGESADQCCWKLGGQREASVLRYKEKRQNRLFSKRIRYEVRKINAEKRPRMKGRFVKRS